MPPLQPQLPCDADDDQYGLKADNPSILRAKRLTNRVTLRPIADPVDYSSLLCGLLAGVAQAGIFNPYDRALYLSVRDHRPFLSWENFKSPYTGFFQSIGGRALSGGLYFPLEHFFLRLMDPEVYDKSEPKLNFAAGTAAGAVNACVLNPLSAIKYKTWGREVNRGMWTEAFGMLRKSGSLRPFGNGLAPTLYRDVVFGGLYTWLRLQMQWWFSLPPHQQWQANLVAAALATVASGPFNYVRNIQYSTSSAKIPHGTWQVLTDLARQTMTLESAKTVGGKLRYLQQRLRIGWGTARVACGMTFGHAVYDWLHKKVQSHHHG
jgi:hypothetical protein